MGTMRSASRFLYEAETGTAVAVADAIEGTGESIAVRDPRIYQAYLDATGHHHVSVLRDGRNPETTKLHTPITHAEDVQVGDTIHSEVFGFGDVLERTVPRVARVRWLASGDERFVVLDTGAWTKVI